MSENEAIAEARDMVTRNFTCEPCVVKRVLAALDREHKKACSLRELLAQCYVRLQYHEHCGGPPVGVESKVIMALNKQEDAK